MRLLGPLGSSLDPLELSLGSLRPFLARVGPINTQTLYMSGWKVGTLADLWMYFGLGRRETHSEPQPTQHFPAVLGAAWTCHARVVAAIPKSTIMECGVFEALMDLRR